MAADATRAATTMQAPDPVQVQAARLHAAPWLDADPEALRRAVFRRFGGAPPAGALAWLARAPLGSVAERRWLVPSAWTATADLEDLLPRSTAGALFLLPRHQRAEAFWAVGLLAYSDLWRITVRRADVRRLDALVGSATHSVRGWLDDERDKGVAFDAPLRIADLGASTEEAHAILTTTGAQVLMRACALRESRLYVRACRWRAPLGERGAWRRRLRIDVATLDGWLADELVSAQGDAWRWITAAERRTVGPFDAGEPR